ncbi:MAG: 5'-3' exonuclease H3TH domain-containing protein [Candidatus Gracilibacteria bacterium]|jgi:DNA polymerase-1|nr:5'-3' exonuclease H3TH domain-containing protein [Candidatus Gracilibacteria bacterium]
MKKLILVDGNSIFHRAYHALPPMKDENGESVQAVLGFCSMLINVLLKEAPDYLCVCFDKKGKTFRHEEYAEYKGTRVKGPDDLYTQFPGAKEFLESFSVPQFELEGFEADDLIATLATQAEKHSDLMTLILTGDRDAIQLVSEKVHVLAPIRGVSEMIEFDDKTVREKYELSPGQMADFKGLFGDNSDNIKGVAGVGKKTAQKLLSEYGSLENIYEHIEDFKGALKEKLISGKENAFMSKRIGTLVKDSPISLDLEKSKIYEFDENSLKAFLEKWKFPSLKKRMETMTKLYEKKKNQEKFEQKSLF